MSKLKSFTALLSFDASLPISLSHYTTPIPIFLYILNAACLKFLKVTSAPECICHTRRIFHFCTVLLASP